MDIDAHLLSLLAGAPGGPLVHGAMVVITLLTLPAVGAGAFMLYRGDRRAGLTMLAALLVADVLAVELQIIVARPRPGFTHAWLPVPPLPSFPSGHAAIAFASAAFYGLCRRRSAAVVALAATSVAISRVYLGHHHPTDVVMGAILGAAVGAVAYGCFYRVEDTKRPRWAWLVWPQIALVAFGGLGAYLSLLDFSILTLAGADKVAHFTFFGGLAFFTMGWCGRERGWPLVVALALLTVVDESLQAWSPVRSFDLLDLAANLVGIAVGATLAARKLPAPATIR